MKTITRILCLIILGFPISSIALPFIGKPYLGAEGGLIIYPKPFESSVQSKFDILEGRLFVGYRFLTFFALEGGYDVFQNSEFNGNETFGPDHFFLRGYDLNAKFMLPFVCGLDFYSQLGGALLKQDAENTLLAGKKLFYSSHETRFLPSAGIGVQYNFNSHLGIRLSWLHLFGSGQINNIDFFPIGICLSV